MGMQLNMNHDVADKKSPFTALALNFFLPGAGYIYAEMYVVAGVVITLFAVAAATYLPVAALIWLLGIVDGPLAVNRRIEAQDGGSTRH